MKKNNNENSIIDKKNVNEDERLNLFENKFKKDKKNLKKEYNCKTKISYEILDLNKNKYFPKLYRSLQIVISNLKKEVDDSVMESMYIKIYRKSFILYYFIESRKYKIIIKKNKIVDIKKISDNEYNIIIKYLFNN